MIPNTRAILVIALLFSLVLLVSSAKADIQFGARAGTYTDPNKAAVGAEVLANLNRDHTLFFNPNVEYVFLTRGSLWSFNFDAHYDLAPASAPVYLWLGGGPAILYRNPDNPLLKNTTNFGFDVLGGIGFKLRGTSLIPYIQPKYTFSNNNRFSLALGVRF